MSLQLLNEQAEAFAEKRLFGFANKAAAKKHWANSQLANVNKDIIELENTMNSMRSQGSSKDDVAELWRKLKELKTKRDHLVAIIRGQVEVPA